jgi:hypothetical protein
LKKGKQQEMIRKPDGVRKYRTAHDRFLKPAIVNFFEREFSGHFGPIVRENIAEELVNLFDNLCPETERLKPGQMLWNALDRHTRADSPKRRYKPVILTVVDNSDIEMFEKEKPIPEIRKQVVARMMKEAYKQNGLLSTRDLSLILTMGAQRLSSVRAEYEKQNQTVLPHTGSIQDMGSTVTHKKQIVHKHVVQKKDPKKVAYETNHSQMAVDRYIKDFYRVKTLVDDGKDIDYINLATNISKHVIIQYQQILDQYVKEH